MRKPPAAECSSVPCALCVADSFFMVNLLPAMVGAIVLAVLVMIFVADPIGNFIDRNPTIKMLALAFIILVGVVLLCDGIGVHVGRGYLYFAMAFSAAVESLNLLAKRRRRQRKATP